MLRDDLELNPELGLNVLELGLDVLVQLVNAVFKMVLLGVVSFDTFLELVNPLLESVLLVVFGHRVHHWVNFN